MVFAAASGSSEESRVNPCARLSFTFFHTSDIWRPNVFYVQGPCVRSHEGVGLDFDLVMEVVAQQREQNADNRAIDYLADLGVTWAEDDLAAWGIRAEKDLAHWGRRYS